MSIFEIVERIVAIPVADGRTLGARLWLPLEKGRWPAIIDSAPYRAADLLRPIIDGQLPYLAMRGYAVLAIDIAGSGMSQGQLGDEYLDGEIDDLVAAIAWAAAQDWCDGGVGLNGLSWAAFAALRAAARQPPALKAMVLGGVSEDGWATDVHYLGGALYTAQVDWTGFMLMLNALPPDPLLFAGDWRAEWKARLKSNRPWIIPWLTHPARDSYWAEKFSGAPGTIPLLLYAGLADKYATSALRLAAAWRGPVRTILGPWEHAMPNLATRGPRIGFLQEALRWWDKFLKGRETDVLSEPPLRLWLGAPDALGGLEDGRWIASPWPQTTQATLDFAVRGDELVRDGETDETLTTLGTACADPTALPHDIYEEIPVPFDCELARRAGARVALSAPFAADCDIGLLPVLHGRTTGGNGQVIARLLDIAPDGTAIRMTTGACNLAGGDAGEIAIALQAMAWRVKAGHRLGLVLSSDGWPAFWPPRGEMGPVSALRLSIPLLARLDGAPAFAPAISAAAASPKKFKWLDYADDATPPATSGMPSLTGLFAAHHLTATATDYRVASRFEAAPLGEGEARAIKSYSVALERPDWSIRIAVRLEVSSTPEAFHIAWRVEAHDGAALFHHDDRVTDVPRTIV